MDHQVETKSLQDTYHAPVALFVYNRQAHLRKTIEALRNNSEAFSSSLYIFSDAPKNAADIIAVNAVRQYIREINGFSAVHINERTENYGLARSIIDGVTTICREHGRVIVLEDDMVVSRYFLKFMNDALRLYEHDERVISIHGYLYPIEQAQPETFFLKAAHCWGWATWTRGWSLFDPDGQKLLDELKRRNLTHQFDFDGSHPYTRMLQNQIAGRNNSWAIRWYASAFLTDKLTLYPGRSLVYNTGMDGSGTHCSTTSKFSSEITDLPIVVETIAVEENFEAKRAIAKFFERTRPALPLRMLRILLDKLLNQTRK